MKLLVVFFSLMLVMSGMAWGARGFADVSAGPHNLSSTGPSPGSYNTNEDSICVFCHTPHGGTLDAPLWNRNAPPGGATWSHYNSASMSVELKTYSTSRAPNAESLICLSCHDGSISVNHVLNLPNDRAGAKIQSGGGSYNTTIIDFFGNPGSRIGGEVGDNSGGTGFLTDDHPISFSYFDVETSTEYQSGAKAGKLQATQDAIDNGVQFFTSNANLECSSCHDPHVNYIDNTEYAPFLIMPNSGSALCLACHIK
jgi:cytochrome c553